MKLFYFILKSIIISVILISMGACVNKNNKFQPYWDNEIYQYVSAPNTLRVDIIDDFSAPTDGNSDASAALQNAINHVNTQGGGEVYIPFGTYRFKGISMKSNVTILVAPETTIKPMYPAKNNENTIPTSVFSFNGERLVKNAQIIGLGGRFNVVLEKRVRTLGAKLFLFGKVDGFRVSNVNIQDVKTTYPMFTFNPISKGFVDDNGKNMSGCRNGVISHSRVDNCHYGYGLVQIQAGENLHFEKISGVGGVTLRAETGAQEMNNEQWGGVYNITGKYVYGKDGNAAVMVSPHSMHNGDIYVEHIISDGCGIGVRIEGGYITDKFNEGIVDAAGTFNRVEIRDVKARFGKNSQLKSKHFKYMPTELKEICPPTVKKISEPAPSIAAVVNSMKEGKDAKSIIIESVESVGFMTPPIVTMPWESWIEINKK